MQELTIAEYVFEQLPRVLLEDGLEEIWYLIYCTIFTFLTHYDINLLQQHYYYDSAWYTWVSKSLRPLAYRFKRDFSKIYIKRRITTAQHCKKTWRIVKSTQIDSTIGPPYVTYLNDFSVCNKLQFSKIQFFYRFVT